MKERLSCNLTRDIMFLTWPRSDTASLLARPVCGPETEPPKLPTEQQLNHNTHFPFCCTLSVLKIPATRKYPGTRRSVDLECRGLRWIRRQYSCRTGGRRTGPGERSSRSFGDKAGCLSGALEGYKMTAGCGVMHFGTSADMSWLCCYKTVWIKDGFVLRYR